MTTMLFTSRTEITETVASITSPTKAVLGTNTSTPTRIHLDTTHKRKSSRTETSSSSKRTQTAFDMQRDILVRFGVKEESVATQATILRCTWMHLTDHTFYTGSQVRTTCSIPHVAHLAHGQV